MRVLGVDPGVGGGLVLMEDLKPICIGLYVSEQDFIDNVEELAQDGVDAAFIE